MAEDNTFDIMVDNVSHGMLPLLLPIPWSNFLLLTCVGAYLSLARTCRDPEGKGAFLVRSNIYMIPEVAYVIC